eukprot:Hpha_TRINITY_DN18864_c0_g1::TRINITY_DN18864_c0_g1_i1::g.26270::m.26270
MSSRGSPARSRSSRREKGALVEARESRSPPRSTERRRSRSRDRRRRSRSPRDRRDRRFRGRDRRDRDRDREREDRIEAPKQIRIGVQAGPRGDAVYEQDVGTFLQQWSGDIGKIELGVAPLDIDEPGWQFTVVEINNASTRNRILDWFNSPQGRRYLVLREMAVKVQEWPLRNRGGGTDGDREAEVIPWKWRKGASVMLSDEYPEEKVLALDSAEGRRYFFKSEDVHKTEGAASFVEQKRKDGTQAKRTVCHHWRRDAHCRFGSECAYIHIKAGAGREDAGAGPSASGMLSHTGKGGGKGHHAGGFGGPQGGPGGLLGGFPGLGQLVLSELDEADLSSSEDDDAEDDPPPPPIPKHDYRDTLLVRDVDKDTRARGLRRMDAEDFESMWEGIEGFKRAELCRPRKKRSDETKYGGAHGLVGFKRVEDATGALQQTFGHGINVAFYGVEELLAAGCEEQVRWAEAHGRYSDKDARKGG